MMLRDANVRSLASIHRFKLSGHDAVHLASVAEPARQDVGERVGAIRSRAREVRHRAPEPGVRVLVISDAGQIVELDAGSVQAIPDCVSRKALVVAPPTEALLLCSGNKFLKMPSFTPTRTPAIYLSPRSIPSTRTANANGS